MLGTDVAQDAAGADGGELLVVSDQPDAATTSDDEPHNTVKGQGVGHPGLIDHHERGGVDACHPVGEPPRCQGVGELGERVAADAGVLCKDSRRGSRRGQADHLTAILGPRQD